MNKFELMIVTKISNFCINNDIEIDGMRVSINDQGVFISLDNEQVPYFQIYEAVSISDAQEWASNGRKNWRAIKEAVELLMAFESTEIVGDTPEEIAEYPETIQEMKAFMNWFTNDYDPVQATILEERRQFESQERLRIFDEIAQYHPTFIERELSGNQRYFQDADGYAAYEQALQEAGLN